MDYYKILNFKREPFSNSPDPRLFFNSKQHLEALQKLEISVRLKRGLNVITGDVGTGKTTISRQLIQKIYHDSSIKYFLILDPGFSNTTNFLSSLLTLFTGQNPGNDSNIKDENILKEQIKKYLFAQDVDNNSTTVLMIDEGQRLPIFCLEVLRELLNYETNDNKLLQIIIFAQKEFNESLLKLDSFNDRISFRYSLTPLGFSETKELVKFRLKESSLSDTEIPEFSFFSYIAIYRLTKGFPRKIINICHHIMLWLIIKNQFKVNYFFVKSCAKNVLTSQKKYRFAFIPAAVVAMVLIGFIMMLGFNRNTNLFFEDLKETHATVKADAKSFHYPITRIKPAVSVVSKPIEILPESAAKIVTKKAVVQEKDTESPRLYGKLKVPHDITLSKMIKTIYGSFTEEYFNQLREYNLEIKDPDAIYTGMSISFPIIARIDNFFKNELFCIYFARETEFKKAFIAARKYHDMGVNIRILPGWDSQKGFLFSVVVNKPFKTLSDANDYKEILTEMNLIGINDAVCEKISTCNNGRRIL